MEISNLDKMEAAVYPAVSVFFNKKEIIIIAKTLSSLEIQSCGDFSLINLNTDICNKESDVVDIARYAEIQHKILKLSMISPTYDEVEAMLLKHAGVEGFHERMDMLKSEFVSEKDEKLKKVMEKEYAELELRSKFFFPNDFLIDMFTFATQKDKSDIKLLVSEEILLNAAIIAENKCLVSDILCEDGYFSSFNKMDINKRATIILLESRSKK